MNAALSWYFADLLATRGRPCRANSMGSSDNSHTSNSSDDDDEREETDFELIFDNARIPCPALVQHLPFNLLVLHHNANADDTCHTRSTISTCGSTSSGRSAGSTGSNSSAGSCRWDSNPCSSKEKSNSDMLKRPKRPGRKTSDNSKNRSGKSISDGGGDGCMEIVVEGVPSNLEQPSRDGKKKNKCDRPQRPVRTSSNDCAAETSTSRTEKRSSHHRKKDAVNNDSSSSSSSSSQGPTLGKMMVHPKKATSTGKERPVSTDSGDSLKEIFRSNSQQRRAVASSSRPAPLRSSLTLTQQKKTVNDILGQSMEELQITW